MEQSASKTKSSVLFFALAIILLGCGLLFGLLASLQYILPGFLKTRISFEKIRPLHVSSVVFWVITAAMGAVLTYIQEHTGKALRRPRLIKLQFIVFAATTTAILISYFSGIFGGREYWEFHPLFSIPILGGWILFIVNVSGTVKTIKKQPVYIWMWFTGLAFFLFTYLESNLWLLPYFRNNIVNDMTIQWKSYGSLVGSWNMLIYGSSIYLMDKIAGNKKYSFSNIGFALYFLGLFNLMFNWSHHIYTLPTHSFVKNIGYLVSMTEIFLLGRIIYLWRDSVTGYRKYFHQLPYIFILAADVWIFLTLALAILMSIPALNVYMHGTHIIVAHTMGAMIGINTMLLLAFIFDITAGNRMIKYRKTIKAGYRIVNGSLVFFWISLLIAGFLKAKWQMSENQTAFGTMMISLKPYFYVFVISGTSMIGGFFLILNPAIKNVFSYLFRNNKTPALIPGDSFTKLKPFPEPISRV